MKLQDATRPVDEQAYYVAFTIDDPEADGTWQGAAVIHQTAKKPFLLGNAVIEIAALYQTSTMECVILNSWTAISEEQVQEFEDALYGDLPIVEPDRNSML